MKRKHSPIIHTPCGFEYIYQPFRGVAEPDGRTQLDCKEKPYLALTKFVYKDKRYNKEVTIDLWMRSDGATGAIDIASFAWWGHDALCNRGKWDDGTLVTNWQASQVLSDILFNEKRFCRAVYWKILTFLRGGGEARKNGMFSIKRELL